MRSPLAFGLALLAFLWCGYTALQACGDKFLLVGRALKYEKAYKAARPASIVLYENPGSQVAPVARELRLEQLLAGAGHKVRIVSDFPALEELFRTSSPDLVLADRAEAAKIEQVASSRASTVVPVLRNSSPQERSAAEQAYRVILTAPGNNRHPLAVIDDALKLKPRHGTP